MNTQMVEHWLLPRLDRLKHHSRLLVRDPLKLLPAAGEAVHVFAVENGYTVVVAGTNLAFRDLYEKARAERASRLLVIDRAGPRPGGAEMHAPAPFYPDLLAETLPEARLQVDLRQVLVDSTGDENWPALTNSREYSRLLAANLPEVLKAHSSLRTAHPTRFTDADLGVITAYAALGAGECAFRKLRPADYLRLAPQGREVLDALEDVAPEVARSVRESLRKAPAPYSWFSTHDPETAVRGVYLAAILSQHREDWRSLMHLLDPGLAGEIEDRRGRREDAKGKAAGESLLEAVANLAKLDAQRAERDLRAAEDSIDTAGLAALIAELQIGTPEGAAAVVAHERLSPLLFSLALLQTLRHRFSGKTDLAETGTVSVPQSDTAAALREAHRYLSEIAGPKAEMDRALRDLKVTGARDRSFRYFWDLWNGQRINRLEYLVSRLERLLDTAPLLPRPESRMPAEAVEARNQVCTRARALAEEVRASVDSLSAFFQDLVMAHYPDWVAQESEVRLTAQFVSRCLKPHWDPERERAAILIFDGMRYDIWDELLRPMLLERMEILEEYPAASILPSETQLTRKAISAGTFPDEFSETAAENDLLQAALDRELRLLRTVSPVQPVGSGTGETVHYRAGNLDVHIFELCDKALHHIKLKPLPDGRRVPSRPLAYIYDTVIKNLLDTEVTAVLRDIEPGTKVFITADHGFGRVGREELWFDESQLNTSFDCSYLNCWLRDAPGSAHWRVEQNSFRFTPQQIRMPFEKTIRSRAGVEQIHTYGAIYFPRVGCAFSRRGSRFDPDAYSHGGASLPEMLIPMVVLRVKDGSEGTLALDGIEGPGEVAEGQEIAMTCRVRPTRGVDLPLDLEVEAAYAEDPDRFPLPSRSVSVDAAGASIAYSFRPDSGDASEEERRLGEMRRTFVLRVRWREGGRTLQRSASRRFTVRLKPPEIERRVGALGSILGLAPKGMRG